MIAVLLDDADGVLGAVGDGEAGLVDELRRHDAVAEDERLPVVVDVEELGRDGVAAVVPLALVGVDHHPHRRDCTDRIVVHVYGIGPIGSNRCTQGAS